MGMFKRIFGPRNLKESKAWRAILMMLGAQVKWTNKDFRALAEAGYINCDAVYACVSLIARGCGGLEWTLQRKGRGTGTQPVQIDSHPLLDLLGMPNPIEGQAAFIEKVIAYKLLAGNSYIEKVGPSSGTNRGKPIELYSLRPDRVKIVPGDSLGIVGMYIYGYGELQKPVPFEAHEMVHIKEFHPLNDLYGLSRLEVGAKNIDIANLTQHWNAKLLQNDARPPGALSTENDLDDEQYERLKEDVQKRIGGADNAGEVLLLEAGLKWQSFSLPPKDMDWLAGDMFNRRKIAVLFNTPPQLIGDTESQTYSNYQEARKALYMEAIMPNMDVVRDALRTGVVPAYGDGLILDYNRDKIDAIQEDRGKKYAYLTRANFMSINEKRAEAGLDDWGGEGDVILVPRMQLPLGSSLAGTSITEGVETTTTKLRRKARAKAKGYWQDTERKQALWDHWVMMVKAREPDFETMAKTYMQGQADLLKAALADFESLEAVNLQHIWHDMGAVAAYEAKFSAWYTDTLIEGGNAGMSASKGALWAPEIKEGEAPLNLFALTDEIDEQLQQMVFNSGTKVNATTIDMIYLKMQAAITKSMTVEEFTQLIYKHMADEWPVWRSRLWARTESAKVENWGNLEGYKQTKFVELRGWLSAFSKDTRDEHIEADSIYADEPISLSEPFNVGGEQLMYPGDPAGSAWNICNCLCSTYPDVREL